MELRKWEFVAKQFVEKRTWPRKDLEKHLFLDSLSWEYGKSSLLNLEFTGCQTQRSEGNEKENGSTQGSFLLRYSCQLCRTSIRYRLFSYDRCCLCRNNGNYLKIISVWNGRNRHNALQRHISIHTRRWYALKYCVVWFSHPKTMSSDGDRTPGGLPWTRATWVCKGLFWTIHLFWSGSSFSVNLDVTLAPNGVLQLWVDDIHIWKSQLFGNLHTVGRIGDFNLLFDVILNFKVGNRQTEHRLYLDFGRLWSSFRKR